MAEQKAIGLIFIEKFADWEFGMLAASAVEWFGVRAVALTPEARPVKSIAGSRWPANAISACRQTRTSMPSR